MKGIQVNYNERAWASDLVSHINQIAASGDRPIRRAGGEWTVLGAQTSLFPDVLLFNDVAARQMLMGWELKLPGTDIDDVAFRDNARTKAELLGLDGFLLWNVTFAKLFVRKKSEPFRLVETWTDLSHVKSRADVLPNEAGWKTLATKIVSRLNGIFDTGELKARPFVEAYVSGGPTALILANAPATADAIRTAAKADATLDADITLWWAARSDRYAGKKSDRFATLAEANLINWLGKLLFAHVLRERDARAAAVAKASDTAPPAAVLTAFAQLSAACDFQAIFGPTLAQQFLSQTAWDHLREFDRFLRDVHLGSIGQEQLSELLETMAAASVRKGRGQYATPPALASLLARLTLRNANGRALDPCAGSGTIARAIQELKLERGVAPAEVARTVWASDVDPTALQLTGLAMAKPQFTHSPLHAFLHDAFDLAPDAAITFCDPTDGHEIAESVGTFHAIASNLPFVRAEDANRRFGHGIATVNQMLAGDAFPGRTDVAAYIPFAVERVLEHGGRLGILITNAWLGTDWGDVFRRNLAQRFRIRSIVTSGAGRWFANAKVIATLVILEKRAAGVGPTAGEMTQFVVLRRPLADLADAESSRLCAAQIEAGKPLADAMSIRAVSGEDLAAFAPLGLAGSAQFVDVSWMRALPLVPLRSLFVISRGIRRGQNDMFYPDAGHGIEAEYLMPVVRNSKSAEGYVVAATDAAFCCGRTPDELTAAGHLGALAWIRRFETGTNETGKPLVEVLARSARRGDPWYQLRGDERARLIVPTNPYRRLFVARIEPIALVDQRLFALVERHASVDVELCHALLNSAIALIAIEGMGFGRGDGVLDLNKNWFERHMHILDPAAIDEANAAAIRVAFAPVRDREVLPIADELERADRRQFDDAVLAAFGAAVSRDVVYQTLLELVAIRLAAVDLHDEPTDRP